MEVGQEGAIGGESGAKGVYVVCIRRWLSAPTHTIRRRIICKTPLNN